jgi:hypothetical protein
MSELQVDQIAGSTGTTVTIKTGHTLTLVDDLDAGSAKITNLAEPTASGDAATKNYVDTQLLTLDTLGELSDVTIASVADNEVLAYDSVAAGWINQTASEAGLATSGDLTSHTSDTSNPHSVSAAQVGATTTSNKITDFTAPTSDLDMNSNKITSVSDPTLAQDAATKAYVDSQVESKDALSELSGTSDDVAEGSTNLYYSSSLFDTDLATKTTDNLTEGSTNLYYADSLVESYLSGGNGISYSSGAIAVDINGATDGTSITVDVANDEILVYDTDATSVKKVKVSQVSVPADIHPFLLIGA